jgi:hypothetical protein
MAESDQIITKPAALTALPRERGLHGPDRDKVMGDQHLA